MAEDFEFKIPKVKMTEIFKRVSYSSRELTFEEFCKVLPILHKEAQEKEKQDLEKKLKEVETKHPTDPINDVYGKYRAAPPAGKEGVGAHPEDEKRRIK